MERDCWKWLLSCTKANLTLDPDTAHPSLIVSENRKSVKRAEVPRDLPDNPERFDTSHCVLGAEGFTSGLHYWEVEVGNGKYWALGVARESLRRKGQIIPTPLEGIWAMSVHGTSRFRCVVYNIVSPSHRLVTTDRIRRIGVALDYERGQVEFLDADWKSLLLSYTSTSFKGERIRPFFWVKGSPLGLCS